MTDARLPERWLNDRRFQRLDDTARWWFVAALMWSVANKTDGVIDADDLTLIPMFNTQSVPRLVDSGLFIGIGSGWLIADFEETQTMRSELKTLAVRRANERARKRKSRAEKARLEATSLDGHVTGHVTESVTPLGQDKDMDSSKRSTPGTRAQKPSATSPELPYEPTQHELDLIELNMKQGYET
jgi:hypothetical protein